MNIKIVRPMINHQSNILIKKNNNIFLLTIIGAIVICLSSCQKKENEEDYYDTATLSTDNISKIMVSSATCGGSITDNGGTEIIARGVCWSSDQIPSINNNKTNAIDNLGLYNYTCEVTGLIANTTYNIRAFATNKAGISYGNIISFTTLPANGGKVSDIEGNIYTTVTIGTQVWLAENLNVAHYLNYDPIPSVTDNLQWYNLISGAYCDSDNNPANSATYGKLYNFYTIIDPRKLCPSGWHIPSKEEWEVLTNYLEESSGGKLKESGTIHWQSPNTGATNVTGFNALPGGNRAPIPEGSFHGLGTAGYWWSSTEIISTYGFYVRMTNTSSGIENISYYKNMGMSVRCIRD